MTSDAFARAVDHPEVDWGRIADTCEACLDAFPAGAATVPHAARRDGGQVVALYRCEPAGHEWRVSWAADAVDLPATPAPFAVLVERVLEMLRNKGRAS